MKNHQANQEFNWVNQDLFNGNVELLEMASFLLEQSKDNTEIGKPVMYVDIDDSFGFPHLLYYL